MDTGFMFRLQKALSDKGITRTQLSLLSGVRKGDITHYLKGNYTPKQDKCYLLAKALDVDPGWLMTGVEQKKELEQYPIVVPDSERFVKLTKCMTQEEFVTVMDIFKKAEQRLKEKEGE